MRHQRGGDWATPGSLLRIYHSMKVWSDVKICLLGRCTTPPGFQLMKSLMQRVPRLKGRPILAICLLGYVIQLVPWLCGGALSISLCHFNFCYMLLNPI